MGRDLSDQDKFDIERIASPDGDSPWLLIGHDGLIVVRTLKTESGGQHVKLKQVSKKWVIIDLGFWVSQ